MIKRIYSLLFSFAFILLWIWLGCSTGSLSTGIDYARIEDAFAEAAQISNLRALVAEHHGKIIKEAYYGPGGADVDQAVRSVTKSVVALLIGLAMEQNYIDSLDQTLSTLLGTMEDSIPPDKMNITVRHLLTMSGGFAGNELADLSLYMNWWNAPNQVNYLLAQPLTAIPGQRFLYNSGAIHLLSVIIAQRSGMDTRDFAQHYLFTPLGIGSKTWYTDKQGYHNGGSGLYLTPHDMLKIGELILNKGEYENRSIISADWIDQSAHKQISTNNAIPYGSGYGFGWWTGEITRRAFSMAMGWGGQFIIVVPDLELVIVACCESSGLDDTQAGEQWYRVITLIMTQIIPSFDY